MEAVMNQDMLNEITLKVKEIIRTNEDISLDQDLTLFGLDSIGSVNLIIQLEEMYNIVFDDEELLTENFSTLRKILERIESKLV